MPWKPESQGQRTASLTELVDMHPTVAALAGIPFTQPMDIGGPDDLGAGEMDAAAGPRFEQAFGMDLSPLFDQKHDERYETLTEIEGNLATFRPHFAT